MEPARTAGGIVIGDGGTLAMVRSQKSGSWLFPKGHIDPGESDEQAARREIAEETGLASLEYLDDLGEFLRLGASGHEAKRIRMFLFAAPMGAKLAPTLEIVEAKWVPYREAVEILGSPHHDWFAKDRVWFASVFERVREAIQRD